MKAWQETAYLASKSFVALLIIPAGAMFWFGWVAIIAGTPQQKVIGAFAVMIGLGIYVLVTWWFGSLSKVGRETGYNHYEADATTERWDRIYYRK